MVATDDEPNRSHAPQLERAIVLELLDEQDGQGCTRAEIAAAIGAGEEELERALASLLDAGVLTGTARRVHASPAARRLDELGLIGI